MFCSKCGFDNSEGSKFCRKCGNKLSVPLQATDTPAPVTDAPVVPTPQDTMQDAYIGTNAPDTYAQADYSEEPEIRPDSTVYSAVAAESHHEPMDESVTDIINEVEAPAYTEPKYEAPVCAPPVDSEETAAVYGSIVKKSTKSVLFLISNIFMTSAFVLFVIGILETLIGSFGNFTEEWLQCVTLSVISFAALLTVAGIWIAFFTSLGGSKPGTFGISIVQTAHIIIAAASAVFIISLLYYAIFTLVSSGFNFKIIKDDLRDIAVVFVILVFSLIFCSRVISSTSKAKAAVKKGVYRKKASVMLPFLCFIFGIFMIAHPVLLEVLQIRTDSDHLLVSIALIIFGLSLIFSGINASVFRRRISKAKS